VRIAAASSNTSAWDLAREMTHGFLVRDGDASVEPGLTAGIFRSRLVLEIVRGVPVARTYLPLQFATKSLLKAKLTALGGASTLRTTMVETYKGMPWQVVTQPVTAPAALCKDVDVISLEAHV